MSNFPVAVERFTVDDPTATEVIVQIFTDKYFVIITQIDKLGTLLQASATGDPLDETCNVSVRVVIGKRDEELQIITRQIMERIHAVSSKPLLLALGLKDVSPEMCKSLLSALDQCQPWGCK
eukprot:Rmarinus@m.23263